MRIVIIIICCLVCTGSSMAQKRLKPPKSKTNIASVDQFVDAAFTIYNTTFDFHYGPELNAQEAEQGVVEENEEYDEKLEDSDAVEIPEPEGETKDEFQVMEESIQQLLHSVPDILEEIDSHSVSRQVKATLNVNKAIKALKQSGKMVKVTFTGQ